MGFYFSRLEVTKAYKGVGIGEYTVGVIILSLVTLHAVHVYCSYLITDTLQLPLTRQLQPVKHMACNQFSHPYHQRKSADSAQNLERV